MSKIFKASNISMDKVNKVYIDVSNAAYQNAGDIGEINVAESGGDSDAHIGARAEKVVANAKIEAARLVHKANEDAESILADVRIQCDKMRMQAAESGRQEGYDAGFLQGTQEAEKIKNEATQAYNDVVAEREQIRADAEPQMLNLVLSIVKKLLGVSVSVDPQIVTNLIKQGLMEATITGEVFVRVSKDDYENVLANKDMLMEKMEGGANLEVIRDLSLNPSDCIIETPFGNIDCSLGQQFETIKQNLLYILENNG